MDDFTIAIYCFSDDYCKKMNPKEDSKRKLNNAEVITTAIISARYFGGNLAKGRNYMRTHWGCKMPDKSNFNRILHRLSFVILSMFRAIGTTLKELNTDSIYIIDSFPVAVCRNIRIKRSKLIQGEAYRGYNSSKREYFYGFKVQVIVTQEGMPVDFFITAGSFHDVTAFQSMNIDLPQGSELHADSAYTDYELEDLYLECESLQLMVARKKNSQRPDKPYVYTWKKYIRKRVETSFSEIEADFPRSIHAVTPKGFLLKILLFIIAYTCKRTIE